jgi:hypothetical protein
VICFDDKADTEALRDPFKKKPDLKAIKMAKQTKEKQTQQSVATPVRQPVVKEVNIPATER